MIDVPANIKSCLINEPTGEHEDNEDAYEVILSAEILEMRKWKFSEKLVAMTFEH